MFGEADWWKLFWELDDLLCCMIVVGCMDFGHSWAAMHRFLRLEDYH